MRNGTYPLMFIGRVYDSLVQGKKNMYDLQAMKFTRNSLLVCLANHYITLGDLR